MADDKPIQERRFNAAVKVIQSLPPNGSFQPSNEMMLKFYSYYKQATRGPCDIPRPGFWDPVGKVKWDAWNSLGDMPREEAMGAYVDELKLILESMPVTNEVEELLQVLGPFYEIVDEKKKISQVSDLTTGFGNMLASPTPKSITKSVVKSLAMNGTLQNHGDCAELQSSNTKAEQSEPEKEAETVRQNGQSADPLIPNGSVEQEVLSLTNGTHGSRSNLNGDLESEEELAHSTPAFQVKEGGAELNGHFSDHNEDVSSHHHLASDSDSEVYCDSMDQFGLEEGSEIALSHSAVTSSTLEEPEVLGDWPGKGDLHGGPDRHGVQHGGEDGGAQWGGPPRERLSADRMDTSLGRRGKSSRMPGEGGRGGLLGGGGDGERWGPEGGAAGSLNEQIVTALARLQEDMQSVLQRLHTLEALTATQARSLAFQPNYPSPPANKKPSWWPFDVSPATVAFAVLWPFLAQWLMRLYMQRRRRRMN
ncbi:acyl-CoA-binding domain-containing protein 5A [Brienomyrus brachyistius]|uniref:acyl-CoA-binding domain-containing protein 5A n=1 Tax=Brienomyrus brachyistius TaxID=42636 RepID=UPI0020B3102B|nr:acyl-CoA-binding domain-containing protein 5A [Brienomyrus brachyistius]XP_048862087.1 acyl-CoA-binding domain-containing protein 5A [Brienomyrus brachyistius]XP_048862088.1 acyl-CoA-binding domain-containing protein 5A [Brienomyrus brachyistius]